MVLTWNATLNFKLNFGSYYCPQRFVSSTGNMEVLLSNTHSIVIALVFNYFSKIFFIFFWTYIFIGIFLLKKIRPIKAGQNNKYDITKGQLISECLFYILNFPKNQQKIWQISTLESKKWSNHKIKAHYNDFNTNYK